MLLRDCLKDYDGLGWVPTIKGGLSLSTLALTKDIFGDVDKYAIDIMYYRDNEGHNQHTEHLIVASSLNTHNDSKYGKEYIRTSRYNFHGSINENGVGGDFLTGHLSIVVKPSRKLTDSEKELLEGLDNLAKMKNDYDESIMSGESLKTLEDQRNKMLDVGHEVVDKMNSVEKETELYNGMICPRLGFDLLLTRDGILLLKNTTAECYKTSYQEDDQDDYSKHIPIHRIFKEALIFVKYLFHVNYHHDKLNDSLLPVSNLHPWYHLSQDDYYSSVFHHQIDNMFDAVVNSKRRGQDMGNCSKINSEGVLLYAKSMTSVFRHHNLISEEECSRVINNIDIQLKEFSALTSEVKSTQRTMLAQDFWYVIASEALAVTFTVVKLGESFIPCWNKASCCCCLSNKLSVAIWAFFITYVLIYCGHYYFTLKYWKCSTHDSLLGHIIKSIWNCIWPGLFMRNSSGEKISWSYRFWVWISGLRKYTKSLYFILVILLIIAVCFVYKAL